MQSFRVSLQLPPLYFISIAWTYVLFCASIGPYIGRPYRISPTVHGSISLPSSSLLCCSFVLPAKAVLCEHIPCSKWELQQAALWTLLRTKLYISARTGQWDHTRQWRIWIRTCFRNVFAAWWTNRRENITACCYALHCFCTNHYSARTVCACVAQKIYHVVVSLARFSCPAANLGKWRLLYQIYCLGNATISIKFFSLSVLAMYNLFEIL
jgi:hypothetical protein